MRDYTCSATLPEVEQHGQQVGVVHDAVFAVEIPRLRLGMTVIS
jgi:hypothetical protein